MPSFIDYKLTSLDNCQSASQNWLETWFLTTSIICQIIALKMLWKGPMAQTWLRNQIQWLSSEQVKLSRELSALADTYFISKLALTLYHQQAKLLSYIYILSFSCHKGGISYRDQWCISTRRFNGIKW